MTVDIGRAVGGGYGAFWRSRHRYRVVKGGKGSKKSATCALWYIIHLMKYPEANLLVVRKTYASLKNSCFAQFQWAVRRLHVAHLWKFTQTPLSMTYLPTGQRVLFGGLDTVERLASTTVARGSLCWVWVEEAFELDSEQDFDKLDFSVPRGVIPAGLFKQTTLTFNPWSAQHWLKSRFFDAPRDDTFTMTATYALNEFLDDNDRQRFEQLAARNPQQFAVVGQGEWGQFEGLVFHNWRVCAPDFAPEKGRHIFGLDYGYANDPTAFIAAKIFTLDDRPALFIYDEIYGAQMLNSDIASAVARRGYGKERIRADAAEPKSNEELRRMGLSRLRAAAKGPDSVRAGIARLQEFQIFIHPACVHAIGEFSAYVYDDNGRPCDRDNHLIDALRYAMEDTAERRVEVSRY
ncbi:MAG: PBSX family phage terminase large subunit [Oscillospiraceae bacterium]|nr:PBSX family phage terminase large subunit [Oscillospiraceae bacterium]